MSIAWIDFKKAFDSLSHEWIINMLRMYAFHENITQFIANAMTLWRTVMHLNVGDQRITTEPINIYRGIFQGDSLSPLLFCLAINPISVELSKSGMGYALKSGLVVNHQWYMDDQKLFARSDSQLQSLISTVERMAMDMGLEFGLAKCATLTIRRGKVQADDAATMNDIQPLKEGQVYQYLGLAESNGIAHDEVKQSLIREYVIRTKKILDSPLIAKYMVKAINTFAVPILTYSFGPINWSQHELDKLDVILRKLMKQRGFHHPKAATERLYLPRREGGRGLVNLKELHERAVISLSHYITPSQAPRLQALFAHHSERGIKSRSITALATDRRRQHLVAKPLHGSYWRRLDQKADEIDLGMTFAWLAPANEGLVLAAQDQVIRTRNYEWAVMKTRERDAAACRICHGELETVDHIINGCGELAKKEYLKRHNRVVQYVHHSICKAYGIPVAQTPAKHKLSAIQECKGKKIYWEMPISTDLRIAANRPDIVIIDYTENRVYIVDISVPLGINVASKNAEKRLKYDALRLEIQRLWKMAATVIPVVVGSLGECGEPLRKALDTIGGGSWRIAQQQAILGTLNILRKVIGYH